MRYVIRESFWSWGDDFHIYNEHKQPVFFVDGQALPGVTNCLSKI